MNFNDVDVLCIMLPHAKCSMILLFSRPVSIGPGGAGEGWGHPSTVARLDKLHMTRLTADTTVTFAFSSPCSLHMVSRYHARPRVYILSVLGEKSSSRENPRHHPPVTLDLCVMSNDLNPVLVVRSKDESDVSHSAFLGPLLELDAELVESLARSVEVVDGDANVTEATPGLRVSIGVPLEVGVGLWMISLCTRLPLYRSIPVHARAKMIGVSGVI